MATDWIGDIPFLEACYARDQDTMKFVDEWLRKQIILITREESEFYKELPSGPEIATLEPSQVTQRGFAQELTGQVTSAGGGLYQITFSGNVNGAALDVDTLKQHVKIGTTLDKWVDGEPCVIELNPTAIDSLTLSCKAYGGTTMVVDEEATSWGIITTPWSDKRNFEQPTGLPRDMEHTFTQIFMREIAITETDKNLKDKIIGDPWAFKVKYNLEELAQEKARAYVRGIPAKSADGLTYLSGYDVDNPGMAGILHWMRYAKAIENDPKIYVPMNNQAPTEFHVRDLAHNLRIRRLAKFKKGRWQLWGHPTTMRYCDGWERELVQTTPDKKGVGIFKNSIKVEGIDVPFKSDEKFPQSVMLLLDMEQQKSGHFKGGQMKRKMFETQNFTEKMGVREQIWGLLPEDCMVIGALLNVRPYEQTT